MEELTNTLDFSGPLRRPAFPPQFESSFAVPARLVPGSHARSYARKPAQSVDVDGAAKSSPRRGAGQLIVAGRRWCNSLYTFSQPRRNVIIVGDSETALEISNAIENDPLSKRKVRAILRASDFRDANGMPTLRRIARQECVDEVIIATRDFELAENIFREARRNQLDVTLSPPFSSAVFEVEKVGSLNLLMLHRQPFPKWQLLAKRLFDVIVASLVLIFISPLLLFIAAVIRLDSSGPAVYKSTRIGHRGRKFVCYKFRTMVVHSESAKDTLRSRNERRGAFFKISDAPRITRVGGFLRRYSLDELPQLWNVLRGDMSLVGPRPHPQDDFAAYSTEDLQRLDSVPGMTGLWQVTARRDPSFERCVELDVEYIRRWTPMLDIRILWKTISCVLEGSGV